VSKFEVHTSSKVVMMYWNLKDWLSYIYETLREMCPIVNHAWTFFTKIIYFLWRYYGQVYVFISFFKKLTKFQYYCYYYVVIWRKKVWIVLIRQFNFSTVSRKWTRMGHMRLVVIFCILLDAHVVQYEINFNNSVEIHLTYRK
jgi:hypothetical protein